MRQDNIVDISTEVTEKDLKGYAEAHQRSDKTPKHLRAEAIHVADRVFQQRNWTVNVGTHVEHAQGFIRTLRETGQPFEPVTVTAVGDRWYLVDGHYRLTAYRSLGWSRPIPVRVVVLDVVDAWTESIRRNAKHGLPMTLEERTEAAWRLVKAGRLVRREITELTTISRSTLTTMRRTLDDMLKRQEEPGGLTWREALSGRPREEVDPETWRARQVAALQRRLLSALPPGVVRKADFLAEAITEAFPGLSRALVEHWREVVEEAQADWTAQEALDI